MHAIPSLNTWLHASRRLFRKNFVRLVLPAIGNKTPRPALLVCLLCLSLTGCSGTQETEDKSQRPAKEAPEETKHLYTLKGDAMVRDTDGNRPIRYMIRWEKTQLDYTYEKGASTGRLEKVSGDLYQKGKIASTFTADFAVANRKQNLLVLTGNVVVKGKIEAPAADRVKSDEKELPESRMECQRLEWNTKKELLKAFGKVTVRFEQGTIGPLDEMWCLPNLKRAGTPGFFR